MPDTNEEYETAIAAERKKWERRNQYLLFHFLHAEINEIRQQLSRVNADFFHDRTVNVITPKGKLYRAIGLHEYVKVYKRFAAEDDVLHLKQDLKFWQWINENEVCVIYWYDIASGQSQSTNQLAVEDCPSFFAGLLLAEVGIEIPSVDSN